MLDDRRRTLAYKDAILKNRRQIEGKVVLEVGCGTGILSVFCAQAGAKKVHAVEASNVADLCKLVVDENNFNHVIQVHHCLIEDLELPDKVDVIVSEWMGFYLLHEGMLDSVIVARDRFLKPEGIMIPESADLWVAPCELPRYFSYWTDVYGIKMESVGKFERTAKKKPVVTEMGGEDLIAEESVVKTIDMKSVRCEEIDHIECRTVVSALRQAKYQGLCLWFVCNFSSEDGYISLSTHPSQAATHWKQVAIVFPFEIDLEKGDPIAFALKLKRRMDDRRKYNIELTILDPEKEEHPTPCACSMTRCVVIQKYLEQNLTGKDEEDLENYGGEEEEEEEEKCQKKS